MIKRAFNTIKQHIGKITLAGTLTIGAAVYHIFDPTIIPRITYTIQDPFATTETEKRIEQKYNIDYEGDNNETVQKELEHKLELVQNTNPELLKHCKKIIVHPRSVTNFPLVKPFIDFAGKHVTRTIELAEINLSTVAHELAHTKHFEPTSPDFDKKLDELFGMSYTKDLKQPTYDYYIKKIKPTRWNDNSREPRNGFVQPYGANNPRENVATYVEAAYDLHFWEKPQLQNNEKYTKTLKLLLEYKYITQEQHERIINTLKTINSTQKPI